MIAFDRLLLLLLTKRRRVVERLRGGARRVRSSASRACARFLLRLAGRARVWRLALQAATFRWLRALDELTRLAIRATLIATVSAAVLITAWAAFERGHFRSLHGGVEDIRSGLRNAQRWLYWSLGWPLPGTPDLGKLDARLAEKRLVRGAPVFIRIFKSEHELELWLKQGERFALFATYPICRFSGALGPKLQTGDRQAPEGFYTVERRQLNPNSRWSRAFNVGFPNLYDRSHGRTGADIMVHGGCSSIGCYAVTNPVIEEIWELVVAALNKGQRRFAVHVFPFRMTDARLTAHNGAPWSEFWGDLKRGYDLFENDHTPPRVSLCRGRYAAAPGAAGSDGAEELKARCQEAADAGSNGRSTGRSDE